MRRAKAHSSSSVVV